MNRSATPLVSGWRTKAKLGVMPRKAIWFWKWSDIKALPWSWRSKRPRAASARTAPQAVWMARSRAWVAAKRSAFSATCQPSASAFQCSTTTKRAMLPSSTVGITAASVPHITPGVGGDASVVVGDRPLRAAVRREQSILAHEAQHPVTADADAIEGAQAGPDLAVPLAGEGRAIEVAADRLEQPRIVDHTPRPSPPARGRRPGDRPGGIEGGARHPPGRANPPHAGGLIASPGVRRGRQSHRLRAKGPGRSMR